MAGYTYPAPPPTLSGDTLQVSRFLNSPTELMRVLRTALQQRYIADSLLSGRVDVEGGAVVYETGESIFTADNPQAVSPGSEYPLTTASTGNASVAVPAKWGEDVEVTDEAVKRLKFDPVRRAIQKLINQNVKYVDSIALSAIASAVTATAAAAASWATATAAQILTDVMLAKQNIVVLNQGYNPDTVVIDDINWGYAMAKLAAAGYLPRENNGQNPILTGDFPVILGMRWLASPNVPTAGVSLVVDSTQLGGMADENLGGPGYAGTGQTGVEAKSIRDDHKDQWRLRCRRVTVPIVQEPAAGRKITGL
jgi:hypothetical protein